MQERILSSTNEVTERARDVVDQAFDKAQSTLIDLKKQKDAVLEELKLRGLIALEDIEDLARKHPGKAIGIAALAGFTIGALMSFRKYD